MTHVSSVIYDTVEIHVTTNSSRTFLCLFCEREGDMQYCHSVRAISYMIKSKFVLCTKVIKSSHGIEKKPGFNLLYSDIFSFNKIS